MPILPGYPWRVPIRMCVGCRATGEQSELVRVARTASGFEVGRTAPGRGAWLHPGCGAQALKRRAIPRALRSDSGDPAQLAAVVVEVDALAPTWANQGSLH